MEISLKSEFNLTSTDYEQIFKIRKACFPEGNISNHYGKQLPTGRILVIDDDQLIGHVGLMLRMIRINNAQYRTMGIQDVVVDSAYRNKGIMTAMMDKAETLAVESNCSLMMLFSSEPKIYQRLGFNITVVEMEWLKIHEGRNLGTGREHVEEAMIKFLSVDQPKEISSIDMLGHIF